MNACQYFNLASFDIHEHYAHHAALPREISVTASASGRPLALRLDDVGASTKRYEVYSKRSLRMGPLSISGNWLFLKYLPGIKAWGPYRELSVKEWLLIFDVLSTSSAVLTVAVTAAWADDKDVLIPFPERFPAQAAVLKEAVDAQLVEIANHGLTHCVLEDNKFKPRLWSSNRVYHREFWDWIPPETQERHLRQSQDILQEYFQVPIVTFVPPGNVFAPVTVEIANRHGLRYISCNTEPRRQDEMVIVGDVGVFAFHDRDIVYGGPTWLRKRISDHSGAAFCFVRDLADRVNQIGQMEHQGKE